MLVVDASVALKWFKREADTTQAEQLAVSAILSAPELILAEVGNALWKAFRVGIIAPVDVAAGIRALPRYVNALVPLALLAQRAAVIACELNHPIYDCFYLAQAEREATRVVSADHRLVTRVVGTPWADHVQSLGEWFASQSGPTV